MMTHTCSFCFVHKFLAKRIVTVISRHPCSTDFVLGEFVLFPELKVTLRGSTFTDITMIQGKAGDIFADFQARYFTKSFESCWDC
jgi:hypothetical protein